MKLLASAIFGISTALVFCTGAGAVASMIVIDRDTSTHAGLSDIDGPDLWSDEPRVVNADGQAYERIPARLSVYAMEQAARPPVEVKYARDEEKEKEDQNTIAVASLSNEHVSWCSARYRSYNAETDSYRAYSGEVRPCMSPYPEGIDTMQTASVVDDRHVTWCSERYRSYNPASDTYQPYDGPRRPCNSPFSNGDAVIAGNF